MIVTMAGLPGTGKSTLARALAERLSGTVLDKDVIRAALFAPAHIEYSAAQDDFCQETMLRTAAYLLDRDRSLSVFLDGRTFSRCYQRERVVEFCAQRQTAWAILECICAEAATLERLQRDVAAQSHLAGNRTPELYREIREAWEPIELPKLVINTGESLESCVEQAMRYLTREGLALEPAPELSE